MKLASIYFFLALLASAGPRAFGSVDACEVVCSNIEAEIGTTLSEKTRSSLIELISEFDNPRPAQFGRWRHVKVVFCVGLSYDFIYVGGHPFVCSDLSGGRYGGFGAGAGFGAGISADVFALIGRLLPGKSISGTYSGGHASGSFGWYGGGVGLFFRNGENGILPDPRLREKLYWIGYEAGFDLDFSAMELIIGKL